MSFVFKNTSLNYILYSSIATISLVVVIALYGLFDHFVLVESRLKNAIDSSSNIHKQGFSVKKLTECENSKEFDVIIIGSGISGLTVGALMARRGWKVLILEQHDITGGTTHNFSEKSYVFDTGLHYIGGNVGNKKSLSGYLFDFLTSGNISWQKLDNAYEIAKLSHSLSNHDSDKSSDEECVSITEFECKPKSEFLQDLIKTFPAEEVGILNYFNLVAWADFVVPIIFVLKFLPFQLSRSLKGFFNPILKPFTSISTAQVINSCVKNEVLAGILSWLW